MAPPDPQDDTDRQLGALSYVLTWVTGAIILLLADRERRYARWNAIQAIGVGVLAVLVVTVASLVHLSVVFLWSGGHVPETAGTSSGVLPVPFVFTWGLIPQIGNLLVLGLGLYLGWRAHQGQPLQVPVLADLADEHA